MVLTKKHGGGGNKGTKKNKIRNKKSKIRNKKSKIKKTNETQKSFLDKMYKDGNYEVFKFLSVEDKHNYALVNKQTLKNMREFTKIIKMPKKDSLMYCTDSVYRNSFHERIDINTLIYLDFSNEYTKYDEEIYIQLDNILNAFVSSVGREEIKRKYYINLANQPILNISILGELQNALFNLDLSYCDYITDISALDKVHTLNLLGCTNIIDVSKLGDVHTLNLSGCTNIIDVSKLGDVHTLNLSGCTNIINVSALGGVHTLDLSGCTNITDVSKLGGVTNLNLSGCTNITDVSALGGVHTLNLLGCTNIINVSALGNVTNLILPYEEEDPLVEALFDAINNSLNHLDGIDIIDWEEGDFDEGLIIPF